MWEHWASTMLGVNLNQTINFYLGNGCNGKSIITNLLKLALGDYSDKCSIQLITDERGKMGQASPELIKLKGKRHINMSEPKKGAILNDGVVKEITGDAELEARGLFKDSITFNIQCKFTACMNNLLEVRTNDDGTWRRIRVCSYMSKFAYPHEFEQFKMENKYVFERDDSLETNLPKYAQYFIAMLIDLACKTNGKVNDCDIVLTASKEYRKNQDYICAFLSEVIEHTTMKADKVRKTEIWLEFKQWYSNEFGIKICPIKSNELYELMDKKYGKIKGTFWTGIKIKYENEDHESDNDD